TPSGSVQFSVDSVNFGSAVALDGSAHAVLTTSALTVGTHTVVATYVGVPDFQPSSATLAGGQVVSAADTTTVITADSPDPSVSAGPGRPGPGRTPGAPAAPGGAPPAGNVVVTDGTATNTCTVAAGSCALTLGAVGPHTITASYQGSTSFNGSTSAGAPHTVNK